MNKSFSKIRHIKKCNEYLEKKYLQEQIDSYERFLNRKNEKLSNNDNKTITQSKNKSEEKKVENLNPKNLKIGDEGEDVRILQKKLIGYNCLKTKYGKLETRADGIFGKLTNDALELYKKQGYCDTKKPEKVDNTYSDSKNLSKTTNKSSKVDMDSRISPQVKNQIDYMSKNGILKDEKFTIVDDRNNLVLAYEPNYKLYKIYNVITGKDKGDQLKNETMGEFFKKNFLKNASNLGKSVWNDIKSLDIFKGKMPSLDQFAKELDSCYFGQKDWLIKNTPSGVFKRAPTVENFMNDLLATQFMEKDYGKRFITWKTLNGDTIPFGFHGTENPSRVPILNATNLKNSNCKKRDMSFGCINFKEKDILDIDKFIDAGQLSIWLPDTTNDIVELSKPGLFSSFFG